MKRTLELGRTGVWITSALVALAGLAAMLWLARSAEAQLGGHSQVTRLELRYPLAASALDARFHLASGLAVSERIVGEEEIDRLLQAAGILAGGKARMSVSVESDKVTAWHLSVP